jgi:ornithine cyclodeaminase/alanine dehydrogenase-like protein (mu-crystallin family)
MTLILSNADVDSLLTMGDCIEAVEEAFRDLGTGRATNRPRTLTYSPLDPNHYYMFSCMDGSLPRHGIHILRLTSDHLFQTTYKGMPRREKLPRGPGEKFCGLVILFSLHTLEPLAILQDAVLNRMMIGATSAVAAKHMSRPDATSMALLGAGWLAYTQVLGHCAVRSIGQIKVYSPNQEHREVLCRDLSGKVEADLIPVSSARAAVEGSDIIACATNSYEPVFDGNWLSPGHHVGSVQVGELDDLTHERAAIIATRAMEPASSWSPPGTTPKDRGWFQRWKLEWNKKLREIGKIVTGLERGRDSATDITLFGGIGTGPSSGLGIQYAPGIVAYRRALERGVGHEVPTQWFLEDFHP